MTDAIRDDVEAYLADKYFRVVPPESSREVLVLTLHTTGQVKWEIPATGETLWLGPEEFARLATKVARKEYEPVFPEAFDAFVAIIDGAREYQRTVWEAIRRLAGLRD